MAQTGYTPILIYSSTTASQAPAAANLTNSTLGSELAINITDGKLFYKDNANAVQVIGWKTVPTTAGGTGLTSYTAGDTLYYASGTTLTKLAIGASKTIMTSSGTAPQWSASLDTSQGGTGLTTYTAGDLIYYASGTTFTKLAIGASGRWLGSSGTAPQWNAPAALTKTDDTNVTLTLGGSASTALLNAASLTLGWTGTLAVSRGGIGVGTLTGVAYGNGTSAFTAATGSQIATAIGTTAVTNATNATNIGITDDTTTSATMYLAWVTSTTGNLPAKVSSTTLTWTPSASIFNIGGASGANSTLVTSNSKNNGNAARLGLMAVGGDTGGGSYPYIGYNMTFTATSTINYNATDTAAAIQFGRSSGRIETYTAASGTGGTAISFTAGPYVASGGTSWTNSSDERLKDIQGEIAGALDMVDQFRAVYHTWKSDPAKKRRVSLIAQDLLPILPEAVDVPPTDVDERSGQPLYMGIEYDYVIPVLVAAIKELRAEFNAYKAAHP